MVDLISETLPERLRRCGVAVEKDVNRRALPLLEILDLSDLDLMTMGDLMAHASESGDAYLIGLLGLMFAALKEGSLCLRLHREQLLKRLPRVSEADLPELVNGFIQRLEDGRYDGLIQRSERDGLRPMVLDGTTGRRLLYFQKYHYHERRLRQCLEAFSVVSPKRQLPEETIRTIIDGLYHNGSVIRHGANREPIIRDSCQAQAIRAALVSPLLIVSGGPGTGKTSLLVNMLRALVRSGIEPSRIRMAAPTGRAAQRMSETLRASLASISEPDPADHLLADVGGSTLHKLLVYRRSGGGFVYRRQRPIPADVVAVDEVSMVDVVMMDRLFQAIDPARTRVILIGDKDQLPSVEAGSVLADLSPATPSPFGAHVVVLRHSYRAAGKLFQLSQAVNTGLPIVLTASTFGQALTMPPDEWAFVNTDDDAMTNRHVEQWVDRCYLNTGTKGIRSYVDGIQGLDPSGHLSESGARRNQEQQLNKLFHMAHRFRVLTVVRRGTTGAEWVNARVANRLRRHLDPGADPAKQLFNGALIMITRNDYERDLYNGDVGLVLRDAHDDAYHAYFKRGQAIAVFPASGLPDWDLAFAMTVHKSQGSEFEDTLLLLPEDPMHRLLTREIIYTAVTRASKRLIICGTQAAFYNALDRKIQRDSGLIT